MSLFTTLLPTRTRAPARQEATSTDAKPESTVRPRYNVNETSEAYVLAVLLPGVAKDGVEVTAEDGQVRIVGRRAWQKPESWSSLYRETSAANYQLVLTHDDAVDAGKIVAELTDGVLTVSLAKAEAVKPRKIAIG